MELSKEIEKLVVVTFSLEKASSAGRACSLQSGRSRVRFPGPDQYSGS